MISDKMADHKGCLFSEDKEFIKLISYRNINTLFIPYYSVVIQKKSKLDSMLFTPFVGWGAKDGVKFTHNPCEEKIEEEKKMYLFNNVVWDEYILIHGHLYHPENIFAKNIVLQD